jgi:hypothetical protein
MNTRYKIPPPIRHTVETIIDAMHTPRKIAENAYLKRILKSVAATHPVQAPVIGSGTATKSISPRNSYFSISSERRLVLSKSQLKNLLNGQKLLKNPETGSSRKSTGTTGIRLPIIEKRIVFFISRPIDKPIGIAPLSSKTGIADMIRTVSSRGKEEK